MTFIRKMQKKRGYECENRLQIFEGIITYEIVRNEIEEKIKCETVKKYQEYSNNEKVQMDL